MKLKLGFSPCPNDTFIFDALVNHKIDTQGYEFEPFLEDVETLNQWALEGRLHISKLSYAAFFSALPSYKLLQSGSALGKGVGPLLISKNPQPTTSIDENALVVLPGKQTTAHLLFSYAYPQHKRKKFMLFSEIEQAILTGAADYGVIIHENRFTYEQRGLSKILDLGNFWEEKVNMPIPLGGIAMQGSFDQFVAHDINHLIKKSVGYAFSNYPFLSDYVTCHAQEMQESVMRQHIDLYVNDFTLDLGGMGHKAIHTLYNTFLEATSNRPYEKNLFF